MTRRTTGLGLGILMCAGLLHADEVARRLQASANVLNEIMATSDKGIPQDLLDKAACMVVVPGLKKGAFFFGGNSIQRHIPPAGRVIFVPAGK